MLETPWSTRRRARRWRALPQRYRRPRRRRGGVSLSRSLFRIDGGSAVASRLARRTSVASRLACVDAAAHRAMLIVGRFLTGRRARQRTACFGTKGLALLNNANIASTDRPACLIASAAYCRVSYSTGLASIASHGALIARLQSAPAKPQSRAVLRKKRPLSLGQTRPPTTPDNRCFPKKWRLGRCNFEQNTVIKSALRGDWCRVQRANVLSRRVLRLPRACASIRSGNAAPTTS